MDCRICPICEAKFMEGVPYWHTGTQATELDLAGLVCNQTNEPKRSQCINPSLGKEGGQTWEYRRGYAEGLMSEFERAQKAKDQ